MTIGTVGQETVSRSISELASSQFANVKFLEHSAELGATLEALFVSPRVSVESSIPAATVGDLYTVWRAIDDVDYVFLYNKEKAATFALNFEVQCGRTPIRLNAWTGDQLPITTYKRSGSGIMLEVALQQGQTAIFAFVSGQAQTSVLSHSENVAEVRQGPEDKLSVLLNDPYTASLTLSDGRTEEIPSITGKADAKLTSLEVSPWNLRIQSWEPDTNESNIHSVQKPLYLGIQESFRPWSGIPQAQNISGVGFYSATFKIPKLCQLAHNQTVTTIDFGVVHHTLRAWVNDQKVPAVDMMDAKLDISEYVVQGLNSLRVETSRTLFNAAKARVDWVKNSGSGLLNPELYTNVDWQPHGLVGPVRVSTLRKVLV